MEQYREEEREIDLRALSIYLLRRWRALLLAALALAVALGMVAGLKGYRQLNDVEMVQDSQKEFQAAEEQYTVSRTLLERQISNIQKEIEIQEAYKKTSILMNIDPYNEYKETAVYYIATDYQIMPGMDYQTPNIAPSVLKAYMKAAQNGEIIDHLLSKLQSELTIRNLKELIQVEADPDNQMLSITTVGNSEELAASIMRYIKEDLLLHKDIISQAIGEHEISLVEEASVCTVDMELVKTISEYENSLIELQTNFSKKQEELLKLKKPENTVISKITVVKKVLKYLLLGFLVGGMASVLWFGAKYILEDRLPQEAELRQRWGVRILARLHREHGRRSFAFIDRWIDRLAGNTEANTDAEAFYAMAAAKLGSLARQDAEIDLIGDVGDEKIKAFRDALCERAGDLRLNGLGNILESAEAFERFTSANAVLILADAEESRCTSLEKLLDDSAALQKTVLGIVILG
ncbi:MAG: hypothetical protein ACTTK0_00750 [Stomatobaculum sp.]